MRLESIATFLNDQGIAQSGVNLFINYMPAESTGVLLREPMGGSTIDWYLPGYLRTSFQILVRDVDYAHGKALIGQITTALYDAAKVRGSLIGDTSFNYIRPRHEPFVYAPTPGRATEFLVNMDCCYVDGSYATM